MAYLFGSMVGTYLMCKALEWLVIKRIIKDYYAKVIVSAIIVTVLFVLVWRRSIDVRGSYYFDAGTATAIAGAVLLPFIRMIWHRIRVARADAKLARAE